MAITFEGYERRIDKINKALASYGIKDLEEARQICVDKGIDVESIVKGVQPIAFENAVWARYQEELLCRKRRCGSYRRRSAVLLHPRLCCRPA